ncbi:MAG: hypothetical protein KC561_01475, partial [Myxococcales bacterium]|nr:hypothetical protein [Myxococcales bacterium]
MRNGSIGSIWNALARGTVAVLLSSSFACSKVELGSEEDSSAASTTDSVSFGDIDTGPNDLATQPDTAVVGDLGDSDLPPSREDLTGHDSGADDSSATDSDAADFGPSTDLTQTTEDVSDTLGLADNESGLDMAVDIIDAPLPSWLGVARLERKIHPDDAVPDSQSIELSAARNEFEPFQIAFGSSESELRIDAVEITTLRSNLATIEPSAHVIYLEELFNVTSPSNTEGYAGAWPDPLVPVVDPHYGEERDVLPLTVAKGETRVFLIDLFVPPITPAGQYTGEVRVVVDGDAYTVPISLRVWDFELPSTPTLRTAYGFPWNGGCIAHHGSYEGCGGDPGVE